MLNLLRKKNFLSLFTAQFLGAFNDNFFKTALVIFVTFRCFLSPTDGVPDEDGGIKKLIIGLAIALFVSPYILFSGTSGQLADKYRKSKLIKVVKFAEIVIMLFGAVTFMYAVQYSTLMNQSDSGTWTYKALLMQQIVLLLIVLFLMGVQSTFFGPLKYGVLPEIVEEKDLIAANGLIEAASFVAILSGTICGGLLVSSQHTIGIVSYVLVAVAVLGFVSSLFMNRIPASKPDLRVDLNIFKATWNVSRYASSSRTILMCILGISWFWLVGSVFMAQLPLFTQNNLNGDEGINTFLLTLLSLGIGVGSVLCQFLLKGEISSKLAPVAAILMTLCMIDIAAGGSGVVIGEIPQAISLTTFLTTTTGMRLSLGLFLLAIFSGLFVVPLQAMLQAVSDPQSRSRTIAANNIVNALFMVLGGLAATLITIVGFGIEHVFIVLAVANTVVAIYICKLLPDPILRAIFQAVFRFFYSVEVRGLDNYKKLKGNAVIIANHVSFIDPVLIAAFLPEKPMFAINTNMAMKWWIKPFLRLVKAFPLDPTNPMATKSLVEQVRAGHQLVIFPEGRITMTGSLMKIYPGPAMIADKADAEILPICIEGAEYTTFARFSKRIKKMPATKIIINIQPPLKLEVPEELTGHKRREALTDEIYKIMATMKYSCCNTDQDLFERLIASAGKYGFGSEIVDDIERTPITYRKLILASFALGKILSSYSQSEDTVGMMLPNSKAAVITFFGLIAHKKTPAILNFTAGSGNIIQNCLASEVKTIVTSKRFVRQANLAPLIEALKDAGKNIYYLEHLKRRISLLDKASAVLKSYFPNLYYKPTNPNGPAVVLFTSGSEGVPKGVVLSHKNILANTCQVICRIDTSPNDKLLNVLPIFHSFGLTGGTMLPIFNGIQTFLYPSPLHYKIIPELSYDINATILFGTDTFLSGYARVAHPYDFYSLRLVVAGAEKLKDETYKLWTEKFGVRIFEGYGATEASPILAVCTPLYNKRHTVGRLVTGMQYKLKPVQGIESGGELLVKGPNIMLGYLKVDNPGVIESPEDGWYATGDVVEIDEDEFVAIKGRVKRFAKIGGEMVSLTAVENTLAKLWDNFQHAVIAVEDVQKGEQLVLFTTNKAATREDIVNYFKSLGLNELSVPRKICFIAEMPLMGTGKVDYQVLKANIPK